MGYGTLYSIQRVSIFVFLCILVAGASLSKQYLYFIQIISFLMIILGLPTAIYGFYSAAKYKDVFDYEPTIFWGKESNGKTARTVLMIFSTIGSWCFFVGGILILLAIL